MGRRSLSRSPLEDEETLQTSDHDRQGLNVKPETVRQTSAGGLDAQLTLPSRPRFRQQGDAKCAKRPLVRRSGSAANL